MSDPYENQDLNEIAKQAERDLNSTAAKQGHGGARGGSDSTLVSLAPIVAPPKKKKTIRRDCILTSGSVWVCRTPA